MRFVTVRDLRSSPAAVWKKLAREKDLVVTHNGKPIAILSSVSEETLEESIEALRRSRAMGAVDSMQRHGASLGLGNEEVDEEIDAVRKARRG